MDVMILLY